MIRFASLFLALAVASTASAQSVRYRRPYDEGYRLNFGFDHDGSYNDDCIDYACGGSCYDQHHGSDLGAPLGTTVLAAADGVVIGTNDGCATYGYLGNTCGGGCGNWVRIAHGDGSVSLYCHMLPGSIRVGTGQSVSCSQPIGTSGSSGSSTGAHLHFGHFNPGSGSASDPWAGGCSRGDSVWVDQGGYRGPPSSTCSCSANAESCNGADDDCDGRIDENVSQACGSDVGECVRGVSTCSAGAWGACVGEVRPVPDVCNGRDDDCDASTDEERVCEHEETTWGVPVYGTSGGAATDANGDGRADACSARDGGFSCLISSGHGFDHALGGGADFGIDLASASSVRMGDVDGDGRDDVCGRQGERFVCERSSGVAFVRGFAGPVVTNATSVELADLDGDGRADLCVRDGAGLACHLSSGSGFDRVVALDALSDEGGLADILHHGSIRFGDLDGDGRADVCVRDADGVACWHSDGDHFAGRVLGPRWSDAAGFDALRYWSTLRLADVDGDGRDDICMRTPDGFRCALSLGRRFGHLVIGPPMQGEGWDRRDGYATLRMGDVNGDGRADVCARDGERLRCWLSSGVDFDRVINGPPLSSADGWGDAHLRYRSIRLADVNDDGLADFCARYEGGLRCALSRADGFGETWLSTAWNDDASSVVSDVSIRIAGISRASTSSGLVGVFGCTTSNTPSSGTPWLALAGLIGLFARRRHCRSRAS